MNDNFLFLYMTLSNIQTALDMLKPLCLVILNCFNINMYIITKRDKINIIKNKLKQYECVSSGYNEENNQCGIIITKKYLFKLLIYIPDNNIMYVPAVSSNKMIVFTTKRIFNELITYENKKIEKIEKINDNLNTNIEYWYRTGDYTYFEYTKRTLHINPYILNTQQNMIYQNIMRIYNKKNNVKCFIYGKISSGKTIISYLIARKINGIICDTFNPTEPSDNFANLYYTINPTPQKPLIVLIDEIDIILNNIHYEKIPLHKKNTIQIYNKPTWNNFLDKINYGLFPNVILIFCSNKSWEDINEMDDSYLREGRIDLIQNLIKI